ATPLDKELAELSEKLNTTYVVYGREGKGKAENQRAQDQAVRKLSTAAAASRAGIKGGKLYRNESWDLVDRLKTDPKLDIKKHPKEELSEELQKMTPEEREKHVKKMLADREALQKKIADLNARRTAWLQDYDKKHRSQSNKAFDAAVRGALRQQAAPKGI